MSFSIDFLTFVNVMFRTFLNLRQNEKKKNFTEIVQRFVKNVNRRKKIWIYAKEKKRANVLDTVCFMLWAVVGAAIRDHWQL